MAQGLQFGGMCHLSPAAAGAHACAGTYGVTPAGVLACQSVVVQDSTATLSLSNGSSFVLQLQPCDRPTWSDTWGPIFAATLVAAVVIVCTRLLIAPFRTGQDHA